MATRKVTVTLPAELVDSIKKTVADGEAASVSAYISEAVRKRADRDPLDVLLAEMIAEHGMPGEEHFQAVDAFLSVAQHNTAEPAA